MRFGSDMAARLSRQTRSLSGTSTKIEERKRNCVVTPESTLAPVAMSESAHSDDDMWSLAYNFPQIGKIRVRESWGDEDAGIGSSVWSSSVKLATFLAENPDLVRAKRVLELGSGCTGLSGIAALKLGAHFTTFTDLPGVLDALQMNVEENIAGNDTPHFQIVQLDWSNVAASAVSGEKYDLILAAECLYDALLVGPFLSVIRHFGCRAIISGIIGDEVFDCFLQTIKPGFDVSILSEQDSMEKRSIYQLTPK